MCSVGEAPATFGNPWHRVRKASRFHVKCNPSWLVSLLKCCFVAMVSFSPIVPHLSSLLKAVWFCIFILILWCFLNYLFWPSLCVFAALFGDISQIVPGYVEIPRVSQSAHSSPYKRLFVFGVLSLQPSLCVCPQPWKVWWEALFYYVFDNLLTVRLALSNGACYHKATGFLYNTRIVCGTTLMLSLKYPEGIDKWPWK